MRQIVIRGVNPEPWTSPSVAVGRKGGKAFPMVYKSAGLKAYQEAIKEELEAVTFGQEPMEGDLSLTFFLWRQLPAYTTDRQRKARKHEADATNLQKALEDALQGTVFKNDRDCKHVQTWIMQQGHDTTPLIVIQLEPLPNLPTLTLPDPEQVEMDLGDERRAADVGGIF